MNMKQLFGFNGRSEESPSSSRRFNRQSSIPRFVVVGDMIRPVPMEGVVPHRRVGERPAGPLFEPRVIKQPVAPIGKPAVRSEPATPVASNPFSVARVEFARKGIVGRVGSLVASVFKRSAPAAAAAKSTVQEELRLDTVKPLRNELFDSDSEVVELQVVQPVPIVVSGTSGVSEDLSAPARISRPSSMSTREIAPTPELTGKP